MTTTPQSQGVYGDDQTTNPTPQDKGGEGAIVLLPKSQWFESLRIAAEEYLRLRLKVNDLRNKGEDDPATDEFKCMAMALEMAWDNYREKAAPREILDLLEAFESRRTPADHSTLTSENARLAERVRVLEGELKKIRSVIPMNFLIAHDTPGATGPTDALDLVGAIRSLVHNARKWEDRARSALHTTPEVGE